MCVHVLHNLCYLTCVLLRERGVERKRDSERERERDEMTILDHFDMPSSLLTNENCLHAMKFIYLGFIVIFHNISDLATGFHERSLI